MPSLGLAQARATVLSVPPFLRSANKRYSFDMHASNFYFVKNNAAVEPLLIDPIINHETSFGAWHMRDRNFWVNNTILGDTSSPVKWTALDTSTPTEAWGKIVNKYIERFAEGEDGFTQEDLDSEKSAEWSDVPQRKEAAGEDEGQVSAFIEALGGDPTTHNPPDLPEEREIPSLNWVSQERTLEGMIYGAISEPYASDTNMPFWFTIEKDETPSNDRFDTFHVVGWGHESNRIELVFQANEPAKLFDYAVGTSAMEDENLGRIFDEDQRIDMTVRCISGYLHIKVNGYSLVYTRVNKDGEGTAEISIPANNRVYLFGSNIALKFNLHAITHSSLSAISFNVPAPTSTTESFLNWTNESSGGSTKTIVEMPAGDDTSGSIWGVDANGVAIHSQLGGGPSNSPVGRGFQNKGFIQFAPSSVFPNFSDVGSTTFITIFMYPENNAYSIGGVEVPNSGTPYFFRAKGIASGGESSETGGGETLDQYIMSASVSVEGAQDYHHIKTTAQITLYNEYGRFNYFTYSQQCIRLELGWNGNMKTYLTGLVTEVSLSEQAGMETVILKLQDYMHVLENTPIINSPFYDGMLGTVAIQDLVERAGIVGSQANWSDGSENSFFLPAALEYTKPAKRFGGEQMISECVLDIAGRFECLTYFNPSGRFIIERIPGGIFGPGAPIVAQFFTTPTNITAQDTLIETSDVEYSFSDVFNVISIYTVSREHRSPILVQVDAAGANILLYSKQFLYNQGALGSAEAAAAYGNRKGERLFRPSKVTSFQIRDASNIPNALDFIAIDGEYFRILGLNVEFSAEDNSILMGMEGEYFGD